jgi:hypothetical protein
MTRLIAIGAVVGLGVLPSAVLGASLDGSAPMLCALSSVMECSRKGDCERSSAEDAGIPPFMRVNVPQRQLSTLDGARTSPIVNVQRANGRLMIQGMQNERVWGAVIDEETGRMSATAGEAEGAFVLIGTCIAP